MTVINVKHLEKLGMVYGGCVRCGNNGYLVHEDGSANRICVECLQRLDPNAFDKITRQLVMMGEKA